MLYVDASFEIAAEFQQAKYHCSLFHFLLPDFEQGRGIFSLENLAVVFL